MGIEFIVDDPFGEFIPLPAGPTVNADTPFAILETDVRVIEISEKLFEPT